MTTRVSHLAVIPAYAYISRQPVVYCHFEWFFVRNLIRLCKKIRAFTWDNTIRFLVAQETRSVGMTLF